jgi:hypothetical protein
MDEREDSEESSAVRFQFERSSNANPCFTSLYLLVLSLTLGITPVVLVGCCCCCWACTLVTCRWSTAIRIAAARIRSGSITDLLLFLLLEPHYLRYLTTY